MSDILSKLTLPDNCRRVLCAVSGGADSVCLLHLLCRLRGERAVEVFAAHFEHGIRGEESIRDADFVRELCEKYAVELRLEHCDVPAAAARKHMGLEETARELRYAFLEKCADELECDYILTAHNADDNAETVLFNLSRGSGIQGLCGIPRRRGRIFRPILDISRGEIEEYLSSQGIAHVEDSSNASDDYSRNLIRHHVMPALRKINPALCAAVTRSTALLRQDEDFLSAQADEFIEAEFDGECLSLASLCALHPAVSGRVLRKICDKSLSAQHVESALDFIRAEGYGLLSLPGQTLRREQGKLYFDAGAGGEIITRQLIPGQRLELPEAGLAILSYFDVFDKEIHGLFKTYALKCESIYGNLSCTGRKAGDRISPLGRGCTKSLKSLFMERGLTQSQRRLCPVIRDEKGIVLVPGLAQAERCRCEKGDRVLCIRVEKL